MPGARPRRAASVGSAHSTSEGLEPPTRGIFMIAKTLMARRVCGTFRSVVPHGPSRRRCMKRSVGDRGHTRPSPRRRCPGVRNAHRSLPRRAAAALLPNPRLAGRGRGHAAGAARRGRCPSCVSRRVLLRSARSQASVSPCGCGPSGVCRRTDRCPGTRRPHDARCRAVGKTVMSPPVSAMITSAVRRCTRDRAQQLNRCGERGSSEPGSTAAVLGWAVSGGQAGWTRRRRVGLGRCGW